MEESSFGTRLLSHEVFEKIVNLYWVLVKKNGGSAPVFDWVFCPNLEPSKPYDYYMEWRRPTYEECIARQAEYDNGPEEFIKNASNKSEYLHHYVEKAGRE